MKTNAMPDSPMSPLQIFAAAAAISSFGGLAALLRSNQPITPRAFCAAVVYSAAMGLVISLLWFNYLGTDGNPYFLLGVSGLAGIGGMSLLDFIVQAISKGGLDISIRPKGGPDDD